MKFIYFLAILMVNILLAQAQDSFYVKYTGYDIHQIKDEESLSKINDNIATLYFDLESTLEKEYPIFYINSIDSAIDNIGTIYYPAYYPTSFVTDRSNFELTIDNLNENAKSLSISGWISIFDIQKDTKNYEISLDTVRNEIKTINTSGEPINMAFIDLELIKHHRISNKKQFKQGLQFLVDVGCIKHTTEIEFDNFIKTVDEWTKFKDDYIILLITPTNNPIVNVQVFNSEGYDMFRYTPFPTGYLSPKGYVIKIIDLYEKNSPNSKIMLSYFNNKFTSLRLKLKEIPLDLKHKLITYPLEKD